MHVTECCIISDDDGGNGGGGGGDGSGVICFDKVGLVFVVVVDVVLSVLRKCAWQQWILL